MSKTARVFDTALKRIIDEWYNSVSAYYITREKKDKDPSIRSEEELKIFHDEKGHRIKFAKGELDFTYGLKLIEDGDTFRIEVSVNNKVENFDYDKLMSKLEDYYLKSKSLTIQSKNNLNNVPFSNVFLITPNFRNNVVVERKEGKADIIRITFNINGAYLKDLVANQNDLTNLIQSYCVAPLRRIYADVYREGRKR